MIDLMIAYGHRRTIVSFMIDTGADLTIVEPGDAQKALGLDFNVHSVPSGRILPMAGIGSGVIGTAAQRVGLLMIDDAGEPYRIG